MKSVTLLDHYLEERKQILRSITHTLERDLEVKAAWLFGSLGRGDDDSLSDIDLWVVASDEYLYEIMTQLHQYASQISSPVLFLEAPQNAPEGGAYLMTCYDGSVAPHIVDWYWQPQSLACIPGQTRLLFDRIGLIHKDQPIRFSGESTRKEITERPLHFISFFWMMLMITAKHAARHPWAEKMELLPLLIDSIVKAHHFLGQEIILFSEDLPSQKLPSEKIHLLHELADQMSEMMAYLSERGEQVPGLIKPGAYRYLSLIDLVIEDKGR